MAIIQVGQMISEQERYLKQPLGEDEKEKKKRLKKEEEARKKKEETQEDDDMEEDEVEAKVVMTPYRKWEKSLMACTTLGQLFIHLTTLDNSIVWSKSIMNTKCKICRRKQDPDKMLLCDGCDNAYHIYCLKPKLKSIPEGDWFCPECKPKERVRSPRKKVRKSFSFHEAESDEEEEEKKETPPKKKSGGRRKIIESEDEAESEDEQPKAKGGNKKGGLANLLGKRGAAKKAENTMKMMMRKMTRDPEDLVQPNQRLRIKKILEKEEGISMRVLSSILQLTNKFLKPY